MRIANTSTFVALVIGAAVAGCKSDSEEPMASKSGAMTEKTAVTSSPPAPTTPPADSASAPVAAPALTDKDMTHVVAKEEAYYTTMPAAGKPASGKLKAGTKVVVLMPRGGYSQVMTADGKRVYTSTAALKPVGS